MLTKQFIVYGVHNNNSAMTDVQFIHAIQTAGVA